MRHAIGLDPDAHSKTVLVGRMRIALLADIHGNAAAFKAIVSALPSVDRMLFAGDACGYFSNVDAVCDLLREIGADCIAGNHERFLRSPPASTSELLKRSIAMTDAVISSENRRWLGTLPLSLRLNLDGKTILMCHGSPWDPDEYIYPDSDRKRFSEIDADVVVLGHTHRPLDFQEGRCHVLNPGSVGLPRDGDRRAACAILETTDMRVEFLRADYQSAEELVAVAPWQLDGILAKYVA
jgi:putative phosphoesterase